MGRPPVISPEMTIRVVLAVLAGEVSVSEAARKERVSEQSVHRWKADFVEAGKVGLTAGRAGPSTREQQLGAEVAELTQALGEAHLGGAGLEEVCWGQAGPFEDLEVARVEAGMPTTRFCELFGIPERTYRPLAGQGPNRASGEGLVATAGARDPPLW